MEYDKELDALISQALREVERDLSLPCNSFGDNTAAQRRGREVKREKTVVFWTTKFHSKSARKCDPTFEGAKTPEENCRTTRDDLAPWEGFGLLDQ